MQLWTHSKSKYLRNYAVCLVASLVGALTIGTNAFAGDVKDEVVKANMRTVQLAVESYALDHGGLYPKAIDDDFKSFMPGSEFQKAAADGPVNPFTTKKEWPVAGSIKDVAAARAGAPPSLESGKIEYSCINDGKAYAVIGGGHDGKALPGDAKNTTLVLSNL